MWPGRDAMRASRETAQTIPVLAKSVVPVLGASLEFGCVRAACFREEKETTKPRRWHGKRVITMQLR